MGRRILVISPDFLVEFLKRRDNQRRSYTVRNPLPDDATIESGRIAWTHDNAIEVILWSDEWQDASVGYIERLPRAEIACDYWPEDQIESQ